MVQNEIRIGEARRELEYLRDKYSYNGEGMQEVEGVLNELKEQIGYYEKAPLFVMTATYYESADKQLAKVVVAVRPSRKETKDKRLNRKIELWANSSLYASFVDEIADWIDGYNMYLVYQYNIDRLNTLTEQIIEECGLPFSLSYALSDNIMEYIADDRVVYGLSREVVLGIGSLDLFSSSEEISQLARTRYANALMGCERATDFRRGKMNIVSELGLRTRKTLTKLVRRIVKRAAAVQRVGLGYIIDKQKGYVGIIKKHPVRSEDVAELLDTEYRGKEVIVREHCKATLAEKAEGLDKLIISYQLTPYNESTGEVFELPLEGLFDTECKALYQDKTE